MTHCRTAIVTAVCACILGFAAAASAADVPVHITLRGEGQVRVTDLGASIFSPPVALCVPPACTFPVAEGTTLRFVAETNILNGSWSFYGWEGACSGRATCELTISAETTLVAQFTFQFSLGSFTANRGSPYSRAVHDGAFIRGAFPPIAYQLESGALPAGLSLASDGMLTGTPTTLGRFSFTVRAIDASEGIGLSAMTIAVNREWLVTTGADAGGWAHVRTFRPRGAQDPGPASNFFAYAPPFGSGVRVAVGDVNEDATPDVITAPGPGSALVTIVDGATGGLIRAFDAFPYAPPDGVYVAAGDFTGDGIADVIAGAGGPAVVRMFDGRTGALLREFVADTGSGARVAAGDVNGDGYADIVVGAGPASVPWVRVYDGFTGALLHSILAYGGTFRGGVYVAAGDLTGDGHAEIVTGAGAGGGPHVRIFDGVTGGELYSFFAYAPSFAGGVRVAVGDIDGDSQSDIVTGAGPGGGPHIRVLRPLFTSSGALVGMTDVDGFFAYSGFSGGVFVAAPVPLQRMSIDAPLPGSTVPAASDLFGWATFEWVTPSALAGIAPHAGIGAVHVWAYPADGSAPRFVGYSPVGIMRPDVAAVLGGSYTPSGYKVSLATLPPGTYDVVVFALSVQTGAPVNRRVVRVTIR